MLLSHTIDFVLESALKPGTLFFYRGTVDFLKPGHKLPSIVVVLGEGGDNHLPCAFCTYFSNHEGDIES